MMTKNFWKQYIEYMKDNPKGYWFKARPYGWGWVPVKWQGWAVTAAIIALVALNAWRLESMGYTEEEFTKKLLVRTFALVVLLIVIAWRTGEKPRWMWHIPSKEEQDKKRRDIHPE